MKPLLLFLLFFFAVQSQAQSPKYNLGFEDIYTANNWPKNWIEWGTKGYARIIDSAVVSEGKYSMRIQVSGMSDSNTFGSVGYGIAVKFTGKKVTMKGKMKMENVADGFASLMLRIDGRDSMLQFDNMWQRNLKGTTDWTEYSIELPLDEGAEAIYIGAILTGTGKIWADDFSLFIDDKDIRTVTFTDSKKADDKSPPNK